jgi:hypothetical protein
VVPATTNPKKVAAISESERMMLRGMPR